MTTVSYDDISPEDPYNNVTPLRPTPQTNLEAERALITTILRYPEAAPDLLQLLEPDDFHDTNHETIWTTYQSVLAQGLLPDHIAVNAQLAKLPPRSRPRLEEYLTDSTTPTLPAQADYYAGLVRTAAIARRVTAFANRTHLQLQAATDTTTIANALADLLDAGEHATRVLYDRTTTKTIHVPTIGDLLAEQDDEYDWVIPGLLEHQERVILTAAEGAGKSTLLRQIAICTAAGIHPFTGETIEPKRVLHVDVENSKRQSKRQYRPLHIKAGNRLDDERLRIEIRIAGIDLTTPQDTAWLSQIVESANPDIILIGPIYKLANGNPNDEESAKPVAMALDNIREESDAAIILEGHSAKTSGMSKKRPHEPFGWSGWMRWPEIGIYLNDDGEITHWRGAREERTWPTELNRGGQWPWTPVASDADLAWEQIRTARLKHGKPMSIRDLENALSISRSKVQRVIGTSTAYGHIWPGFNKGIHPGEGA